MRLRDPLNDLLASPAKVAILRVMAAVNAPLSGREIARRAHVWPSAGLKALGELAAAGVLVCSHHGRVNTYQLERTQIPLVHKLRELFRAEADRYRELIAGISRGVPEAISVVLFGSEARGDAGPGSDTDLLIVVPKKSDRLERRVLKLCMGLAEEHGLALAWHLADLRDLRKWNATNDPFWTNVRRDGIVLYGDPLGGSEAYGEV
jgi:uncharacterized protein